MFFRVTKWHKENPNDWVALEMTRKPKKGWGTDPNFYILRGRHKDLMKLIDKIGRNSGYSLGKAWGYGIGKDMKVGESRHDYEIRKYGKTSY